MPLKYQCFLFDLDNTLVDTDNIKRETLLELGFSNPTKISDIDIRTKSPTKFLNKVGKDLGTYWKVYKRKVKKSAEPITNDLISALDDLKYHKAEIGIITATPVEVAITVLKASGLYNYFEKVWFSRNKVNTISKALDYFKCDTNESIYIGDLEKDYLAAQGADIDFALALWGCISDDPIIDDVDILLDKPSGLVKLK